MTTQWDRFESRASLALDDLGWNDTIEIFNASASYSGAGDGYSQGSYGGADATIDAATLTPRADPQIELDGLDDDLDLTAYIPSDNTVTIRDYDVESETPTRVKVLETGTVYEVQSESTQGNGLNQLRLVEVDN